MAAELEKEKEIQKMTPHQKSSRAEASLKAERNGENGENKTEIRKVKMKRFLKNHQ